MDGHTLLGVIWVLSGLLVWWFVVRCVDQELAARHLVVLPLFVMLAPVAVAGLLIGGIITLLETAATAKPIKSWKDKK